MEETGRGNIPNFAYALDMIKKYLDNSKGEGLDEARRAMKYIDFIMSPKGGINWHPCTPDKPVI